MWAVIELSKLDEIMDHNFCLSMKTVYRVGKMDFDCLQIFTLGVLGGNGLNQTLVDCESQIFLFCDLFNKDRFCNTIVTVFLIDSSIQSG